MTDSTTGDAGHAMQARSLPARAPIHSWLGFFAMVLGMFMAVLDIQVVASSLGELQGGLAATADEISWVQTSYLVAEIIVIPLTGILSRWLSTRILFVASCAGFAAASMLCAFAWDLPSMVVFRALQGLLGGAMIPTVFSVPYVLFPKHQQQSSLIAVGLTATLAPTLGPVLGGWITETFSWRWIFLVNPPVAALVIGAVWRFIDVDEPDRSLRRHFDLPGLLLMAVTLGSLQYALEEGPRWDWLEDDGIALALSVSTVAGALFVWRVLVYRQPIVDIRAFKDRNFATGCLLSFVFGIGIYVPVYVLPLFLGQVRGYNALQIGSTMVVLGAFQFLSAPVAANLSKVLDLRAMLAVGFALFGVGSWMNSGMNAESALADLFWPQAARGLALMLCFVPINTLALGTLPPERLANASGLYNLMRNLGGAIGIAAVDTIFEQRHHHHLTHLTQNLRLGLPGLTSLMERASESLETRDAATLTEVASMKLLVGWVDREAKVMTYNDLFLLMGLVFAAAATLIVFVRRPERTGEPIRNLQSR
jgi:DHA2 family multidrug resistance protein